MAGLGLEWSALTDWYTAPMETPRGDRAEVRGLFLNYLELADGDRVRFLENLSAHAREELQALLDSDQGAETMLHGIVTRGRIPATGVGERFGPFVTTELIGR